MTCQTVLSRYFSLLALVTSSLFLLAESARAQPNNGDQQPPRARDADLIQESKLKIKVVDDDGELYAVPGVTLKDYLRDADELERLKQRLKQHQAKVPSVSFGGTIELDGAVVPASGKAKGFLGLDASFQIRLNGDEAESDIWVPVPLGLDGAFLNPAAAEHQGLGDFIIDKDAGSFVCWLHTRQGTAHTIRVRGKVAIERLAGQHHLSVNVPNMSTTARITIPGPPIEIVRQDNRIGLAQETNENLTVVTIQNGGGGVELAWRERGMTPPPLLDARGIVSLYVHGNDVSSEAQLAVRSRGEPIDRFVVELPPDMKLTSRNVPGFQITRLPSESDSNRQLVLIQRLDGPTTGPMNIHLAAAAPPIAMEKPRRMIEAAGYSVQGAERQLGSVDVVVEGNWSVTWLPGNLVQRDSAPVNREKVDARFLYNQQPYSLRLDLRQKQPRVSAKPTYVLAVSKDTVELDAEFDYSTTGTAFKEIELEMPGWTIDDVFSPDDLLSGPFAVEQPPLLHILHSGPIAIEPLRLRIPLASAPTRFKIQVKAHRTIREEDGGISIRLPRLSDTSVSSTASVVVRPAANIELTPQPGESKSLTPETNPPPNEPAQNTVAFFYRTNTSTESSLFVAHKRLRPRELSIQVSSRAELRDNDVAVVQTLSTSAAFGPPTPTIWEVPRAVIESKTLRFSHDNQDAPFQLADSEASPDETSTRVVIELDGEQAGSVDLEARYTLPLDTLTSEDVLRLPLIQPVEDPKTKVLGNSLVIVSDETYQLELSNEDWTPESDAPSKTDGELHLRAAGIIAAADVRRSRARPGDPPTTSVTTAWIQTQVTSTARYDRVCFRFTSDQPQLQLELPSGALAEDRHAVINGRPRRILSGENGSIRISQDEDAVGKESTVEIWYYSELSSGSKLRVALPKFVGTERIDRVYWQLVLPRNQHLAWSPRALTPELVWTYDGGYWGRRGLLEQPALEELLKASSQAGVPLDTNRYLFSAIGSARAVDFVLVDRLKLMGGVSGVALAIALCFIYFPVLRHPGAFFAAGIVLAALAMTFPEHAVLCAQTGAIGLGMALLASVLNHFVGHRGGVTSIRRDSVYVDSYGSSVPFRKEGSSRATTATAPAHLQAPQVEDES
jgi:hypothetical protein